MKRWLWIADCPHCGYRTRGLPHLLAKLAATIHYTWRHPRGMMTVGCVDVDTYRRNRQKEQSE